VFTSRPSAPTRLYESLCFSLIIITETFNLVMGIKVIFRFRYKKSVCQN
jgi:hypothetical protein